MRVFLGSSSESSSLLLTIAGWIENAGHTPVRWSDPGVFPPGQYTFSALRQQARQMDAAIFVFAEDDRVWYRTDQVMQPRDNVLIEFGLFSAALGDGRVVICRSGNPKPASDISGVTYVQLADSSIVRAERDIIEWLTRLQDPEPGSLLLERLKSPFQASGKRSLFLQGTDLLRRARNRVALVAKTPIVLVGCRPYDDSQAPFSYESDQLDLYRDIVRISAAGKAPDFICVASRSALVDEVATHRNTSLPVRVQENCERLQAEESRAGSRVKLRWYDGAAPMTFLVCDDDFIIWFKDSSGESVWITAHDEVIARALYSRAEAIGHAMTPAEVLNGSTGPTK